MTKDSKEYMKAWREANKDKVKAYYQAHKEQVKAWREAHKEQWKEYQKAYHKAWYKANKEQWNEYLKADVNSLGESKNIIRMKSRAILNKTTYKRPGYEIHHCFGYEDPSKFIYISKSLHLKIHQYLRDNNISADSEHWMSIRDLVNSTDEFVYIRC